MKKLLQINGSLILLLLMVGLVDGADSIAISGKTIHTMA